MPQLDKERIAISFSKAAQSYDGSAAFQRDVGHHLLSMLAVDRSTVKVVDLGCGTGYFSEQLLSKVSADSSIIGLDIAQGMLKYASDLRDDSRLQWLCSDAENLALASSSIDLVFSSLAIQWCEHPTKLFAEIKRVLKPGGVALLSSLGPNSLYELKAAWANVDQHVHVNHFIAMDALLAALPSELEVVKAQQQQWLLEYDQLKQLTADLKNIGAHNMNSGESKGLTGRSKIMSFKQNYELYRQDNGKLPASYEVYFLKLCKAGTS